MLDLSLFQLLKSADITAKDLKKANEQELIAMEKRVGGACSLHPDFSKELVAATINAIRNHPGALAFILEEPTIKALFTGEYKHLFNAQLAFPDEEELGPLQGVFQSLLEHGIHGTLFELIRRNEWEGLYIWLKLKPLFSKEFITVLEIKLLNHIYLLATDISRMNWNKVQLREYSYASNTTFYLVMNQLDSPQLEELWYRFLSESKGYADRLQNMRIYHDLLNKLKLYRPDDWRFQQKRSAAIAESVAGDFEDFTLNRPHREKSKTIWAVLGVALTVILVIFKFGRVISRVDAYMEQDKIKAERQFEVRRQKQNQMKDYLRAIDFSMLQQKLSSVETFGSCKNPGVLRDRYGNSGPLKFEKMTLKNGAIIMGSHLDSAALKKGKPLIFVNNTKQDVVAYLIMSTNSISTKSEVKAMPYMKKRVVLIQPGDSIFIEHYLIKFFLHSGKQFCHLEGDMKLHEEFSWGFCGITEADSLLANRGFKCFKNTKEFGGRLSINKEKENYVLDWVGKTYMIYDLEARTYIVNYARNPIKDLYEYDEEYEEEKPQ